jgi:septal ring factor EnvC (AmiA/AmiB activator)
MEQGTGPQQPQYPPDPDSLPATKGDVGSLRRWLIVAGVWAVAASVIAVIALVSASSSSEDSKSSSGDAAAQVARLEQTLNKRIDKLESSIHDLPTADDLSKLESDVKDAQDSASSASATAKDARSKLSDLEKRVSDLEQASQGDGGTTTTPP